MNVLVLGGTVFLGRHVVAELIACGHTVTTFNRGTHAVDAGLPVTRIVGDRTRPDELARIPAAGWDAVIDPSSDVPGEVEAAARHLRGAGRYIYISSVSAYDLSQSAVAEDSRLHTSVEGDPNAATAEAFGWRKATSEARVAAVFGERATCLRPGLIVGRYDPTDRFTYWPVRIARAGHVLVPGPPDGPVQFIDVRDVAAFVVRVLERDLAGVYNVTSPRGAIRMRDVIDAARDWAAGLPVVHWVDGDFLVAEGCTGWSDLPLWIPADSPYRGIVAADVSAAIGAGLTFRPLHETVHDTGDWYIASGRDHLLAGLDARRETELLDRWNVAISS